MNAPTVLIVEDERLMARDLQESLQALGYDAYAIAASCDEALQKAAERRPDLALLDIRIAGPRDGVETASLLQQRYDVPVIYLTAHSDALTVEKAKGTLPHGYLTKPVRMVELRTTIELSLERHQAERRVRARERWYGTTLRSVAESVVCTDPNGRILLVNPVAAGVIGAEEAELQGRLVPEAFELLGADGVALDPAPVTAALRSRTAIFTHDALLVSKISGRRVHVVHSTAPVLDGDELLGAVMVFRDTTEERRLQREVELSNRLSALGTMAAGVAHEINNPLGIILTHLSLLEAGLSGGSTESLSLRESLMDMQGASERIRSIVESLRPLGRREGPVGSVDVASCLRWALRSTQHEVEKRAVLSAEVPTLPAVHGDEVRLSQVFVNLLLNAAQAIEAGGLGRGEVGVRARREGPAQVVVEVSDTGAGMTPEVALRVFEPFFSTKPPGQGTGIGLFLCQQIVSDFGGSIELESTPGQGTVFRVRLRVAP